MTLGIAISAVVFGFITLSVPSRGVNPETTSVTGKLFIAGPGKTSASAIEGAVFPEYYRNIHCVDQGSDPAQ